MMRADAVFEGGGVKGVGLVGAVVAVEERGYEWMNVAGTSAGAIVASLVAAGYGGRELRRILEGVDYRRFKDSFLEPVGPALTFLFTQGLYLGDYFERWLRRLLLAKGVRTFRDLVLPEFADDPRYRYRLRVVASDISRGRMLVLPQDAAEFGVDPDDLDVTLAVRMSMSIPFFYRPVRYHGSVIVDGGLLSNFPVWLFDDPGRPAWPTFGFTLVDPGAGRPHKISGPISFLKATVSTMLEAHDERFIADEQWVRTIGIPTLGVGTTDFNLSKETGRRLFQSGYAAAQRFLDRWDFQKYIELYREDPLHHSRDICPTRLGAPQKP